ncbi:hypothetical protein [Bradyrhizobium cenepequi]
MLTIQLSATPKGNGYQATLTFSDGVSISSEEAYPTIAEVITAAAINLLDMRRSVWRHSTEQARDQRLLASSVKTSPWHASGADQQMRSRPRSSSSAFMSAGCATIHARYFAMTSAREPSRPMTNGLPPFTGATDIDLHCARTLADLPRVQDLAHDRSPFRSRRRPRRVAGPSCAKSQSRF